MSKWLEQFNENYYGRSPQAKELEQFMKSNYQGSNYIPWATMERLVYQQDPEADFRIRLFETCHGGQSVVLSNATNIETRQITPEKSVETMAQSISHFVAVELTFLGKHFEEIYPVQDLKYGAPKVIDQNMINKSLQRAKAKIASRGTGLALSLYEVGDLQFEDVIPTQASAENTKPEVPKRDKSVIDNVAYEGDKVEAHVGFSKEAEEAAADIRANDQYSVGLQKINNAVVKKYGFTLGANDVDLVEKLNQIENLKVFMRTLRVQSGIEVV
jgi:hypothetical protein